MIQPLASAPAWSLESPSAARPGGASFADALDRRIPSAFENFVRWSIEREWEGLAPELATADRVAFARYYRTLPGPASRAAIANYVRGLWCTEPGWVWRWLMRRAGAGCGADGRPRVLDAGSGFGTFSMLFASLGAEVVGVDLREDRVRVARVRLAEHRRRTARQLSVRFERENLVEGAGGPYDLIWAYNAISHIDPPGRFLEEACASLAPGGVVVVADINGANLAHLHRLRGVRKKVEQAYVSPEGVVHPYAIERTFAPATLRALARRAGLQVTHHEVFYCGLGRLPGPVVQLFLRPLQRCWWLGTPVGRRQLLVATPTRTSLTAGNGARPAAGPTID